MRRLALAAVGALLASLAGEAATYNGYRWFIPIVDMHLSMPGPGRQLIDGNTSWESVVASALGLWNPHMVTSQLRAIRNSTVPIGENNGYNNVFFASSVFGRSFNGALAITATRTLRDANGGAVERDVVFNTAYMWDSYRGALRSGLSDLRRVAAHEFGHVIGLGHPDADAQQFVQAIMNEAVSDIDALMPDDIGGAQLLYMASNPTTPVVSANSVTPNQGYGHERKFTLRYRSSAGAFDIAVAQVAFSAIEQSSPSGLNNCVVSYDSVTGLFYLVGDNGLNGPGAPALSATVLSNSQCSLDLARTTIQPFGEELTLNVSMTFSRSYHGEKNILMYAIGRGGQRTNGWQDRGDWTIARVKVDSVTVNPATAYSPVFTVRASSVGSVDDINELWMQVGRIQSPTFREYAAADSCILKYDPRSNVLTLISDFGGPFSGSPGLVGSPGVLQNRQCFVNLALVIVARVGSSLTLHVPLTFFQRYAGGPNIFTEAFNGFQSSGNYFQGTVSIPPTGPTWPGGVAIADSATPNTGGGAAQLFALTYTNTLLPSDVALTELSTAWVNFAQRSTDRVNSCLMFWNRAEGRLYLLDDSATTWSSGRLTPLFVNFLENSQCSVSLNHSSAVMVGDSATLRLAMFFKPAYGGTKNIWMFAAGSGGGVSDWQDRGDWMVQPTLSITGGTVFEGNAGQRTVRFSVSLSGATTLPVTVSYSTVDGTATAASGDYVPTSGTVVFAPKTTATSLVVAINGDATVEDSEAFTLALSSPSGAAFLQPRDSQAVGTIANDDFTDASLVGVVAKSAHITELRALINALRRAQGFSDFPFSAPLVPGSTLVTAADILELRTAVTSLYATPPGFSEAIVPRVTPLRAVHIQEIRERALNAPLPP